MFRRFTKRFEFQDKQLGKVTYPRNWAGEVSADVAKAADAAKVTLIDKDAEKRAAALAAADQRESAERELSEAEAAVTAASSDSEKKKAEARVEAARKDLAALPKK